jgi:hypothetical protein
MDGGGMRIVDVQEGESEAQAVARESAPETCPRCKGKMGAKDSGVCNPCGEFVRRKGVSKSERTEEAKAQAERAAAWAKERGAVAGPSPEVMSKATAAARAAMARTGDPEAAVLAGESVLEAATPKRTELLAQAMKTAGVAALDTPANVQRLLMAVAVDQRSALGLAIVEAAPDFRDFIGSLNGDPASERRWQARVNGADSERRRAERRVVPPAPLPPAKPAPEVKVPQKAFADALDACLEIESKTVALVSADKGRLQVQVVAGDLQGRGLGDVHLAIGIPASEGGVIQPIALDLAALRKAVAMVASRSEWVHLTRMAETLVVSGKRGSRTVELPKGWAWRADVVPGAELAGLRCTAEVESFPLELALGWAATALEDSLDTLGVNGQWLAGKSRPRAHVSKLPFTLAAGPARIPAAVERAWGRAVNGFGCIPNEQKVAVTAGETHFRFSTGFNEVSITLTAALLGDESFKPLPELIARELAKPRTPVEIPPAAQAALDAAGAALTTARRALPKGADAKERMWTSCRWEVVSDKATLSVLGGAPDKVTFTTAAGVMARGLDASVIDFGMDPSFATDCMESDDYGLVVGVAQYEGHSEPYLLRPARQTGWEHFALVMPLVALPGYRSLKAGKAPEPEAKPARKRTPKAAK